MGLNNICHIKEKPCKLFDEECLAVHPSQCPHNNENDIKAILEWQKGARKWD
jgi:hypothetical protein